MSQELTTLEAGTLQAYEKAIERGLASFVEVGRALTQIRENRLYRGTHDTFEDYCQDRWDMTRQRANQVIEASGVADRVKKFFPNAPEIDKASHAEELAELPAEEQPEAWQEAVETAPEGRVTAEHVENVVRERRGLPPKEPPSIWRDLSNRIEKAELLFGANAQETDQSKKVKACFTQLVWAYDRHVKDCEAV